MRMSHKQKPKRSGGEPIWRHENCSSTSVKTVFRKPQLKTFYKITHLRFFPLHETTTTSFDKHHKKKEYRQIKILWNIMCLTRGFVWWYTLFTHCMLLCFVFKLIRMTNKQKSGHGSRNAAEDPWSNVLQLNTGGLIANKISVIERLIYKNKAFIIVLQETHCTTADKLVIPNFSLVGSVLSRNHGLATFVYEQLEWSLVDQSPEQSETQCLCVDVAGYNIINVYKPPLSRFTPTAIPTFPHPSLYVGDLNCQQVHLGCNKTSLDRESLDSCATSHNLGLLYNPKKQPASSHTDGASAPTQTWPSRISARIADCRTDVFLESSRGHNIGLHS